MNTIAENTQPENAATKTAAPTVKLDYLRAALNYGLKRGGAWYVYLLPSGVVAYLNPWSDSSYIEITGAVLLFAAELSNLTPEDEAQAMQDESARDIIVDNLIDNNGLIDAANELLEGMHDEAAEDAATVNA